MNDHLIQDLSKSERNELWKIISQIEKLKDTKSKPRQIRDIVPIDRWLEDEYYVGLSGLSLYDYWKKEMIDIFGTRKGMINEVIISGGIGTGKSTFALYCMLRKLYELSCFENIPSLFDLMPNTLISFMYFSVSRNQAELTGFGQYKSMVSSISYFLDNFPRNERIGRLLSFPENMFFLHGSSSSHAIGMNMIGTILDEANFFNRDAQNPTKSVYEYSRISNLYTSIVDRATSRFMSKGKDDSLSILVSSNTTASSFTEQRIQQTLGKENVKVINARLWETKPKGTYSNRRFFVFEGSDLVDPFVITSSEDVKQVADSYQIDVKLEDKVVTTVRQLPAFVQDKFIPVPIDFKSNFENNVITALQNIAGRSVAPSGRLFGSRPTYFEACSDRYEHPFTKEEIIIATQDKMRVCDFIRRDFRPKMKSRKRYIHIDQSTTNDSTGFASAYASRYIEMDGILKPVVAVDLQLRINPPKPPQKISIGKVRDFVFFMRDHWGLEIGMVSYDSFASEESFQVLTENGVNNRYLSVDRTDDQYLTFVNMLYEGRIEMYDYLPSQKELFELIHMRDARKIDHPVGGSKDVMDAVVGAVWNCLQGLETENVRPYFPGDLETQLSVDLETDEEEIFTREELMRV